MRKKSARWSWRAPEPRQLATDVLAGLQGAISSLPGGMAAAVLVGVQPIQGLYACVAGPIAGGLTARTRLMVITTTGAVALAAGSELHNSPAAQRPGAVALLAGLVAIALLIRRDVHLHKPRLPTLDAHVSLA